MVVPDDVDDAVMIRRDKETDVSSAMECFRRSCFLRGRPLADIVLPFCGRRSELSIVSTAGLTVLIVMSAERHC